MPDESKFCPECRGSMTRGFLFAGIITPWFEGEPKEAMLGGTKPPQGQGRPNAAYRCGQCGFLELYAGPEHGPR
jgi:hypothetical protein